MKQPRAARPIGSGLGGGSKAKRDGPKVLFGILFAFLLASRTQAAELRLTINGVHSDRGELLIGLYDTPDGFLGAISRASKSGLTAEAVVSLACRFAHNPSGRARFSRSSRRGVMR